MRLRSALRLRLLVVGDGPEKTNLENLAPFIMVASPGGVSAVRPYYHAMDVLVLPSRTQQTWKTDGVTALTLTNDVIDFKALGLTITDLKTEARYGTFRVDVTYRNFPDPEAPVTQTNCSSGIRRTR